MWRLLYVPLLLLCSCAAVFVQTGFNSTEIDEAGLVSFVQFTAVSDGRGSLINVTVVTLSEPGFGHDLVFCGNHPGLFPMNSFVRTRFRPGATCGLILFVAIEQHG